jgi:CBS domain-containing protein
LLLIVASHVYKDDAGSFYVTAESAFFRNLLEELHSVTPDALLTSALESMSRYDLNQLPVVSNKHLEGVLSRARVLSYLQTHAELQG